VLTPSLLPHPMAQKPWEQEQERNLAWVAATRAKFDNKKGEPGSLIFCGALPPIYTAPTAPAAVKIEPQRETCGDVQAQPRAKAVGEVPWETTSETPQPKPKLEPKNEPKPKWRGGKPLRKPYDPKEHQPPF
jgi:hypothetical protein